MKTRGFWYTMDTTNGIQEWGENYNFSEDEYTEIVDQEDIAFLLETITDEDCFLCYIDDMDVLSEILSC